MNGWGLFALGLFLVLPIGLFGSSEDPYSKGPLVVCWLAVAMIVGGLAWGVTDLVINGVP